MTMTKQPHLHVVTNSYKMYSLRPYLCMYCKHLFNDFTQYQSHTQRHKRKICYTHSYERKSSHYKQRMHFRHHQMFPPNLQSIKMRTSATNGNYEWNLTRSAGEISFHCKYCNESFSGASQKKKHEMTHTMINTTGTVVYITPVVCYKPITKKKTVYLKIAPAPSNFHRHCTSVDMVYTKLKPYQCEYCTKRFTKATNKTRHEMIHIKEKPRPYQCKYCTKCFSRSDEQTKHERIHSIEKPFQCKYCTKRVSWSYELTKHERIHTKEKPFKCKYCSKHFSHSGDKTTHERIHTKEKPYQCEYCTKSFTKSTNKNKTRHEMIHTKVKPYQCKYCTKCFSRSDDLTTHERIHTKEKPHQCKYCTKRFTYTTHKTSHEKIHMKPYQCEYCTKCFSNTTNKTTHERRIHTKEKSYQCKYCTKCFLNSGGKATHERIHTKEKPYQCKYCTKYFSHSGNRSRHEKNSHQKETSARYQHITVKSIAHKTETKDKYGND